MLSVCSDDIREKLLKVLSKLNLPTEYKAQREKLLEAVSYDKKAGEHSVTAVICENVGEFVMKEETLADLDKRMERFYL